MNHTPHRSGLSRRAFIGTAAAAAALTIPPAVMTRLFACPPRVQLRLGGGLLTKVSDPVDWARAMTQLGYTAASLPLSTFYDMTIDDARIKAYADAAIRSDIVIAEVATFFQTFPDEQERKKSIDTWCTCLEVADRIGARCAPTVGGERIPRGAPGGPSPMNLNADTFDMVVENTRKVIDAVKPTRTYFAYQTMGWFLPNSPDNMVRLIKAVDRERFAAHLDITNLISGADRYFDNAAFTRECFRMFGSKIRSCHVKDVLMTIEQPVHITEVRPGLGTFDHRTLLKEVSHFPDIPILLEHLATAEEFALAAQHIRSVAAEIGVGVR
jgi:sugar phosphate isomerase/epimerase